MQVGSLVKTKNDTTIYIIGKIWSTAHSMNIDLYTMSGQYAGSSSPECVRLVEMSNSEILDFKDEFIKAILPEYINIYDIRYELKNRNDYIDKLRNINNQLLIGIIILIISIMYFSMT